MKTLFGSASKDNPVSFQFWMLAAFFILLFLTGGASRVDVQSLLIIRPASILFCGAALLTLNRQHWAGRHWLFAGMAGMFALNLLHLVPLPPALWHSLPGRGIVADIDKLVGLGDVFRPITFTPMNGWHSFLSLFVPLAVLLFGVQLSRDDLYRLLPLLIALGAASGLIGMLQITGNAEGPLYFYNVTNNGKAVGLFANRNHAAVLLACMLPMLAIMASFVGRDIDNQKLRQMLAAALSIILIPLILVTGSRSGLLLALIGVMAAAVLYARPVAIKAVRAKSPKSNTTALKILGGFAAIGIVGMIILFARSEAVVRLFASSTVDESRDDIWRVVIDMVWTYFPFGTGAGSFVEAFQIHEPNSLLNYTYLNRAHNDWLELAVTFGLPGLLMLAVAIAAFVRRNVRLWRRSDGNRRSVKMARMSGVVILMLAMASVADYPLRTPIMMGIFALMTLWFTEPGRSQAEANAAAALPPAPNRLTNGRPSSFRNWTSQVTSFDWPKRIGVVLTTAAGVWFAFALAVSGVIRTANPLVALTFMPGESMALAAGGDLLFVDDTKTPPERGRLFAIEALKHQAINAPALRLLGFYAELDKDRLRAETLIAKAAVLKRRDSGAQLWLLENSVGKNNVSDTLTHYDILLRTTPKSRLLLFSKLLSAIEQPELRVALLPYVKSDNPWASDFLGHAVSESKNLPVLVDLISEIKGFPKSAFARDQERQLLERLVAEKNFADARRVYLLVPGAQADRLTDASFSAADREGQFGVMGWQMLSDANVGGGFTGASGSGRPMLSLFANSETTRVVARKLLFLSPATYQFRSRLSALVGEKGGNLQWQLRCASQESGPPFWQIDAGSDTVSAALSVPANCPVQFLEAVVSGGSGQSGTEVTVVSVGITR